MLEATGGHASGHEVAEYALLGLLREGPRHGYRLAAEFEAGGRLDVALRLKMAQMYAYLRKLERYGLLASHDESGSAGRMRRVFALTGAGERAFDAWLAEPVAATRDLRLAFLVKLAFTLDDPAAALALLDAQRSVTAALLARLEARGVGDGTLARLALRRRILLTGAALAWLEETRAALAPSGEPAAPAAAASASGGVDARGGASDGVQ